MPRRTHYSFTHYLAAKKSVDDRALNRQVWECLAQALARKGGAAPLRVLEVGCGIGTMVERLLDAGMLAEATYTAIDAQVENLAAAHERLSRYRGAADAAGPLEEEGFLVFHPSGKRLFLELEAIDLFDFIRREQGRSTWDLLIAHAFLDLVDVPSTLPLLFSLLSPGGLFYFTLNFDGATILEPEIDPDLDRLIEALYHRSMDERLIKGKPSGDSLTGRHLFSHLRAAGAQLLAAGASDWVVFPGPQGYAPDEAYFLHFLVHTVQQALHGHPELEGKRFDAWIKKRQAQIERRELIYIAHQLDFLGYFGAGPGN
jgi:SAM-dependent methyltransferase